MKNAIFVLGSLFVVLLLFGCASQTSTPQSNTASPQVQNQAPAQVNTTSNASSASAMNGTAASAMNSTSANYTMGNYTITPDNSSSENTISQADVVGSPV
jgi:outer membrane biogenesis lipoprotein LolB